jgi:hypothetical protein
VDILPKPDYPEVVKIYKKVRALFSLLANKGSPFFRPRLDQIKDKGFFAVGGNWVITQRNGAKT